MEDRIREAFEYIKADDALKEKTLAYVSRKNQRKQLFRLKPVLACCCIMMVMCFGGYSIYFDQAYAVSMDINPSIELSVNRFDRVIDVRSYGSEGNEILKKLNLKHMNCEDAVFEISGHDRIKSMMAEGNILEIGVIGDNVDECTEKAKALEKCAGGSGVHCYHANEKHLKHAHESGFSYGKYRAYLTLKELDPSVTEEMAEDLTIGEMRARIADFSDERSNENCDSNCCHSGDDGGCHRHKD